MEQLGAKAIHDQLHEEAEALFHNGTFAIWSKTRSRTTPFGHNEGVTIGVADEELTPWDHFLTDVDASPVPPPENSTDAVGDGAD